MLAQNFLTADVLGITEAEREALVKVLGMLERGELVHSPHKRARPNGFNMDCTFIYSGCGTVACIGGWVAILAGFSTDYVGGAKHPVGLNHLYWPNDVWDWSDIPVDCAGLALRNYLTLGEPRWAEVMT